MSEQFLGLFNFIGSTKHSVEQIAEFAEDAAELFIAQYGKRFSLSAAVHCINLIKTGAKPFADVEFYGIQPRKILTLFNKYKRHIAKEIQQQEQKQQRAEIEKSKAKGVSMPPEVAQKLQQLVQKNEQAKIKLPARNVRNKTIRLIERVEMWVLENVPPVDQQLFFEGLQKDWVRKYKQHCDGVTSRVITESDYFELCAEDFLNKNK